MRRTARSYGTLALVTLALPFLLQSDAVLGGPKPESSGNQRTGSQAEPAGGPPAATDAREAATETRPFTLMTSEPGLGTLRWNQEAIRSAAERRIPFVVQAFPLRPDLSVDLELEPFEIAGPDTQFVVGRKGGPDRPVAFDPSTISLLRGGVIGHADSHVFLALSDNLSTGYIDLGVGARRYQISAKGRRGEPLGAGRISVFQSVALPNLPPGVPLCGVDGRHPIATPGSLGVGDLSRNMNKDAVAASFPPSTVPLKHMELAVDTDYEYFVLFGDEVEATAYLYLVYASVSDIYMRDVHTRIELVFTRVWDDPDDLYNSGDPLQEFWPEWETNMGAIHRDAAQLLSGRRDYPFGGQAYLSALCYFAYGVVGYAVGSLPDPSKPSPFNYDVSVTAHELGHNAGTGHTHDDENLAPDFIDSCHDPNSTPQRGSIMSYCGQTWSGGNANRDNYFHTRIQENIDGHIAASACIVADCNMNNVDDAFDIAGSTSDDTNGNNVPDECEDCNENGVLDPDDIAGASFDKNGNGTPDECEPDCNNNTVPDDKDIADATSVDAYGNGIPDECEADCNGNGVSDYTEIQLNMPLDVDRDAVLDSCQDCDSDGTGDHDTLAGSHNLWVASGLSSSAIREFFPTTGVLTRSSFPFAAAAVHQGQDVIVAPTGHVLVTSAGSDRVMEFDTAANYLGDFVPSGAGGLDYPTGLIISPGGELLVSSRNANSILAYDGTTGAVIGTFVGPGAGGLVQPFGLTYGPNGNLFVTSAANEILEFHGTSGSFVGKLVSATDNGGLDQPRGLTFKADGNLLVASYGTDEVLEFEGQTGAPLGKWAQVGTATRLTQDSPWGVRVGPNGHVFVSRTGSDYSSGGSSTADGELHLTDARMYEFNVCNGLYRRTAIGGNDHGLDFTTGFAFVPGFAIDCNRNMLQDGCDITSGFSDDVNTNGVPDECETDCNANGKQDHLDLIPFGTSYDCNCNFLPDECDISSQESLDCDANGVPDECEDCNANGLADACDIGSGTSDDCNINGTPDECESDTDCNSNGEADICDLAIGTSRDCNGNAIPDTCDAQGGGLVLDVDFESGLPAGWTATGIFQITGGCAVNPVCDGSAWAYAGSTVTCGYANNQLGELISPPIALAPTTATLRYCTMVDTEEGYDFASVIVNGDVVAQESGEIGVWEERTIDLTTYGGQTVSITFRLATDAYVTAFGWQVDNIRLTSGSEDCDQNSVPDECDPDCNANGIPNYCDIAGGTSDDLNANSVPDECECPPAAPQLVQTAVATNRYLSITPGTPGQQTALRVTFIDLPAPFEHLEGLQMWVGQPQEICENSGQDVPPAEGCGSAPGHSNLTFWPARLECDSHYTDWSAFETVHVHHWAIVPGAVFQVQAIDDVCAEGDEAQYSGPLGLATSLWGDLVEDCTECPCGPPDDRVDVVTDLVSILNKFSNLPCAVQKTRADIQPNDIDFKIDISDAVRCLGAFEGDSYPFGSGQCVGGRCSGGGDHGRPCSTDNECGSVPCTLAQ